MLPYIYPEIYEYILRQLPIQEGFELEDSARALARCAAASSTLRGIACLSHIWRPHFEARWKHHSSSPSLAQIASTSSVATDEPPHSSSPSTYRQGRRTSRAGIDYRRLYIERREKDRRALDALNRIISDKTERYDLSLEIVDELGMDAWDVLRAQKQTLAVPRSFEPDMAPSEDWFARSHWIDEVRTIFRYYFCNMRTG